MNFINDIFNFLTNRSIKKRYKAAIILASVIILFLLDSFTGFTFYYSNSKKIEQVAHITETLKDTALTPILRYRLEYLRAEIINYQAMRQSSFDEDFDLRINLTISTNPTNAKPIQKNKNDTITAATPPNTIEKTSLCKVKLICEKINNTMLSTSHNNIKTRNDFVFMFSSFWSFVLISVVIIITVICDKKRFNGYLAKIKALFSIPVAAVFSLCFYFIFETVIQSPILNNWYLTYIIVAFISAIVSLPMLGIVVMFIDVDTEQTK
jgi:hypothetical protein